MGNSPRNEISPKGGIILFVYRHRRLPARDAPQVEHANVVCSHSRAGKRTGRLALFFARFWEEAPIDLTQFFPRPRVLKTAVLPQLPSEQLQFPPVLGILLRELLGHLGLHPSAIFFSLP